MAEIHLDNVAHSYLPNPTDERDWALKPMDHVWRDGDAYALLGPSGCGKTTLLNVISGLISPSHGRVRFNGHDVTTTKTEHRNIAQVFQFPVIYDTMSVFDNLAFPLRNRKLPEPGVRFRVQEIAELLELTPDLKYRASGLSADVKQTISLGRGLVRKDVAAILFDEPLTVIDPHLKWTLRRKLKQIHQELKHTLIYVTHDQVEALTFADQVVVMFEGQVVQQGTPQELFDNPAHTFVGYFTGSPGMNLLPCALDDESIRVGTSRISLEEASVAKAKLGSGRLTIGVRPEFLQWSQTSRPDGVPAEIHSLVLRLHQLHHLCGDEHGHVGRHRASSGVCVLAVPFSRR